eukprot:565556-Amphidinium_carterae.1
MALSKMGGRLKVQHMLDTDMPNIPFLSGTPLPSELIAFPPVRQCISSELLVERGRRASVGKMLGGMSEPPREEQSGSWIEPSEI